MHALSLPIVAAFCVYAFFHFYMTWHVKNFQGSSRGFEAFLSGFAILGMVFQYGFLIWFGIKRSWPGAGLLLVGGLCFFLLAMPLEVLMRKYVHRDVPYFISLLGFIVLPTCVIILLRAA